MTTNMLKFKERKIKYKNSIQAALFYTKCMDQLKGNLDNER